MKLRGDKALDHRSNDSTSSMPRCYCWASASIVRRYCISPNLEYRMVGGKLGAFQPIKMVRDAGFPRQMLAMI
jgi:hypothetical protein